MSAQRLLVPLLAALALAALVACGGDDDGGGNAGTCGPATTGQPTPAPSTPPELTGSEVTTASGLKYIDICIGAGRSPTEADQVTLFYTGWIAASGRKFDSSVDRGGPTNLAVAGVVPGFEEGLLSMREGGQRRLIIPPDLAYGEEGFPGLIPPNSTLIFDIEIVKIIPPGG